MKTKIETLSTGHRLVKRYRKGRCFACVWSPDSTDEQIARELPFADFLPYNEATGEFVRTDLHRPSHFKA